MAKNAKYLTDRVVRCLIALVLGFGLLSCDDVGSLSAQIQEINQQISDYQQAQEVITLESAKLGNLGTYENAGVKEHTVLRIQLDTIKKDVENQKAIVQKLQSHIETLQRELDDYRASS